MPEEVKRSLLRSITQAFAAFLGSLLAVTADDQQQVPRGGPPAPDVLQELPLQQPAKIKQEHEVPQTGYGG